MEALQESNHKLQVDLAEAREEVCKRDQTIKSLQAEVKKLIKRMQAETTDLKRQRTELEKDLDKAKNEIEILQAQAEGMRKNHNNLINLMKRFIKHSFTSREYIIKLFFAFYFLIGCRKTRIALKLFRRPLFPETRSLPSFERRTSTPAYLLVGL